jgi:hypothetical protein
MCWQRFKQVGLIVLFLWLTPAVAFGQGFLVVDQASGTTDELIQVFTRLPDNQIAQSFTPSLSAVGFIQFQTFIFAISSGETLVINLRQGAYNGPIVSSTDPVFLINKIPQVNTFYFPGNIPVTPNQLYFFEPVVQSAGSLDVGIKFPSSYSGGEAWNNGLQGTGDYWFREGVVVPEPGSVWLLLVGFGGLLCHCRLGRRS